MCYSSTEACIRINDQNTEWFECMDKHLIKYTKTVMSMHNILMYEKL